MLFRRNNDKKRNPALKNSDGVHGLPLHRYMQNRFVLTGDDIGAASH